MSRKEQDVVILAEKLVEALLDGNALLLNTVLNDLDFQIFVLARIDDDLLSVLLQGLAVTKEALCEFNWSSIGANLDWAGYVG